MTTTFPWILQRYIFREMGKTFLLAAVALAAVLGLGGGLVNMIELGEATPAQLLRMMGFILPVSAALTLPMAALFAAAATYGRLAADNELVACRSSGINIHLLLLPTLVISLIAATVTFVFTSFLIPGMVRNLNELIRADVGAFIQQRLSRPRGITLGGPYRIQADETTIEHADADRITLHRIAFVEVDGEEWVRFGTARAVHLEFERRPLGLRVSGRMEGLSYFDRREGQFGQTAQSNFATHELQSLVPPQIKFLTLGELFHYIARPEEWVDVRERMDKLRAAAGRLAVYAAWLGEYHAAGQLTLRDGRARYVLRAASGLAAPRGGGVELREVTIEERRGDETRIRTAERTLIEVSRANDLAEAGVTIHAYEVRGTGADARVERVKESFGPIALSAEMIARGTTLDAAALLAGPSDSASDDPLRELREKALAERAETVCRIRGTIHERLAFSVSVFVLVVLGAALGIILRGAHVVTAFGICFVPSLLVIVTIVMGKQMANNPPTHAVGLLIIWLGILIAVALDAWILTRVLRR